VGGPSAWTGFPVYPVRFTQRAHGWSERLTASCPVAPAEAKPLSIDVDFRIDAVRTSAPDRYGLAVSLERATSVRAEISRPPNPDAGSRSHPDTAGITHITTAAVTLSVSRERA
jgi:hypothetical protein